MYLLDDYDKGLYDFTTWDTLEQWLRKISLLLHDFIGWNRGSTIKRWRYSWDVVYEWWLMIECRELYCLVVMAIMKRFQPTKNISRDGSRKRCIFLLFHVSTGSCWNRENLKSVGNASRFFRFEIFLSELGWSALTNCSIWFWGSLKPPASENEEKPCPFFGYMPQNMGVPKKQQRVIVSLVESHLDFRYTQFWDTHSWSCCWRFGERSSLPCPETAIFIGWTWCASQYNSYSMWDMFLLTFSGS